MFGFNELIIQSVEDAVQSTPRSLEVAQITFEYALQSVQDTLQSVEVAQMLLNQSVQVNEVKQSYQAHQPKSYEEVVISLVEILIEFIECLDRLRSLWDQLIVS